MKNKTGFLLFATLAALFLIAACINWYTDLIMGFLPWYCWSDATRVVIAILLLVTVFLMAGFAAYFYGNDNPGKADDEGNDNGTRDDNLPEDSGGGGHYLSLAEILMEEDEVYA